MIRELRAELAELREAQRRSEDRVLALEDERQQLPPVSAGVASGVSREYVDQRIEAFETSDESRLLISGYGAAEFRDARGVEPSSFRAQFNPIFHFRLGERLHFNSELEFELDDGGETALEMEFATIDFLATDWLTLSAGKFLTPFNVFGSRLHPTWINKLASRPVLYEKRGGVVGVISDVGVMASGGAPLWNDDSKFNYAFYVTNGPIAESNAELEFDNTPDENDNKTAGGRVGFLPIPNLEVGVSGMSGRSRGSGGRFGLVGADFWYAQSGFELRGEYANLDTDADKWGYYVQLAYRLPAQHLGHGDLGHFLQRFEPVLRWGETNGHRPDNREQVALGLNYWLQPSVPLKFTYEINSGGVQDDRLLFQLAYGF